MSASPSVSVIVVNYNTPRLTAELLNSLLRHSSSSIQEILVVDNNSDEPLKYVPEEADRLIRVWHLHRNLGFGRAINFAAEQAGGRYLLLANSDCLVDSDTVGAMVDFMEANPRVGICSPRVLFPDGRSQASARELPTFANIRASRRSLWRSRKTGYTLSSSAQRLQVPALSATFVMLRREQFTQLGGFDPSYVMYVEDTDLCRRIAEKGGEVYYLGDQTVLHHWGASSKRPIWRLALEHHRSIRHYFRKTFPGHILRQMFLGLQLAVNLAATLALTFILRKKV